MAEMNIKLSAKQKQALELLFDKETKTLVMGGGYRSGKSFVLALFALISILKHSGIRILVARQFFTDLRNTTIKTFKEVIELYGFEGLEIKMSPFCITNPNNGSEIIFLGVDSNDKNAFRGLSLTHVLIDEANELPEEIIKFVYGRLSFGVKENDLISKVFLATNATKNWLYREYYCPAEKGKLAKGTAFINCTLFDNEQFLPQDYISNMTPEILGEEKYELFVLNNWHFTSSSNDIFVESEIHDLMTSAVIQTVKPAGKHITIDPAGFGKDSCLITYWDGWVLTKIIELTGHITTQQIVQATEELKQKHSVPSANIIVDSSGLGKGVHDYLRFSEYWIANATAQNKENYASLKDQCIFRMAAATKQKTWRIHPNCAPFIDRLAQEAVEHKQTNSDLNQKQKVTRKEVIKRALGRSPDVFDSVSMRFSRIEVPAKPEVMVINF